MTEGWYEDRYFVLFSDREGDEASAVYRLSEFIPGYSAVGLRSWDDLLLAGPDGQNHACPCVPLTADYLEPVEIPEERRLTPDGRWTGKVKWYVQPLVFGGPPDDSNMTWVTHEQHRQLVAWWNTKYREMKTT